MKSLPSVLKVVNSETSSHLNMKNVWSHFFSFCSFIGFLYTQKGKEFDNYPLRLYVFVETIDGLLPACATVHSFRNRSIVTLAM